MWTCLRTLSLDPFASFKAQRPCLGLYQNVCSNIEKSRIREPSYLKLSRFDSGLLSGLSMFEHKAHRDESRGRESEINLSKLAR